MNTYLMFKVTIKLIEKPMVILRILWKYLSDDSPITVENSLMTVGNSPNTVENSLMTVGTRQIQLRIFLSELGI